MSRGSKIVLAASIAFTGTIITYVHWKQNKDRAGLRVGILRDLQQQNMKRTANLKNQQDQIELTKVLREKQAMEDAQSSRNQTTERPDVS